jgi:AAA+ superfamily predicted ATPase
MNQPLEQNWTTWNQAFLADAIKVVKAELKAFLQSFEKEGHDLVVANEHEEQPTADSSFEPALKTLVNLFDLSSFEKKILLLCAGVELDAEFNQIIQQLLGSSSQNLPTLSLALSAFEDAHWSALTPEGPLRYWRLIEVEKTNLLTSASCWIDESILHYLTGLPQLDHRIRDWLPFIEPKESLAPSHQQLADEISNQIAQFDFFDEYPIIQLKGGSIEDRMAITTAALSTYQMPVFKLSINLLPNNIKDLADFTLLWNRMSMLNHCALFIDAEVWKNLDEKDKRLAQYFIEKAYGVIVVGSNKQLTDLKRPVMVLDATKPIRVEQEQLWQEQLGHDATATELLYLTAQFDLDAHTIQKLAQIASIKSNNGLSDTNGNSANEHLWDICRNYTRPALETLAQRIEPLATWDDLILPQKAKNVIREIAIQVEQRRKVYYDWGFADKSNRGLGISALFSGESGTGKTMASEVLANELQLDLYRIDLSQVVNKYIGETEKNLKRIFDAAEGSGAILLFDEADALFGKRSEVKDSHDRYSNIEVSYLLQKMEEYNGLAVLTTNMRHALDKAFLRRIRFVVPFPFPDAPTRTEIWKKAFPASTPTQELDYHKLAALTITGGNIRNIALNASFVAAGENRPVSMPDIQHAARNEYQKLEKHMSAAEFLF